MDMFWDDLVGIYAYDEGATDSGIHDESRRAELKAELQIVSTRKLTEYIRDEWMSNSAIAAGYTIEDVVSFLRWLDEIMGFTF